MLAAAETAFAERGFDGASIQQIAAAAGVSRGMPGYAFGSKEALYQEVLGRAFAQPRALAATATERLRTLDAADVEQALRTFVEDYLRFLVDHPNYVALIQRAALDGGDRLGAGQPAVDALGAALATVVQLDADSAAPRDPRQLVVTVLALCFFPVAHQATLLAPLGLDLHAPGFVADWAAHVVGLVLTQCNSRVRAAENRRPGQ